MIEQLYFTELALGKGVVPDKSGYQIKAVSPGLMDRQRQQLYDLCVHYGETVYEHAPEEARDAEFQWRGEVEEADVIPEEVLSKFPVIWTYDRLSEDRYALTRVRYLGYSHDGRPGNFFAHCLVFDPENLISACEGNPLALADRGLFVEHDSSDVIELPTLTDWGTPPPTETDEQLLFENPYREQLPAIVSALSDASRPVILAMEDWRNNCGVVRSLLNCLPPQVRCRTTFCTFESEPDWSLPNEDGKPSGLESAHRLILLADQADGSGQLRPEDRPRDFAVFDFRRSSFAPITPLRPFASFLGEGNGETAQPLHHLHHILRQLGVENDSKAWDQLVPVAQLATSPITSERMESASRALLDYAKNPQLAKVSLDLLAPHSSELRRTDEVASSQLLTGIGELVRSSLDDATVTASERVYLWGMLAELSWGSTEWPSHRDKFLEDAKTLPSRTEMRSKLTDIDAIHILVEELCAVVSPWDEETSPLTVDQWFSDVGSSQEIEDRSYSELATRVTLPEQKPEQLQLPKHLLYRNDSSPESQGIVELSAAILSTIPLTPPAQGEEDPWHTFLDAPPAIFERQSPARWRVLHWLRELEPQTSQDDWSLTSFPNLTEEQKQDILALEPADRETVRRWFLSTFYSTGITCKDDALHLIDMLEQLGKSETEDVVRSALDLLEQRDPVTQVNGAMTFVELALDDPSEGIPPNTAELARALVEALSEEPKRLLLAHLLGRFRGTDVDRHARLQQFLSELEASPSPAVPVAKVPESAEQKPGLMKKLWNLFGGKQGPSSTR